MFKQKKLLKLIEFVNHIQAKRCNERPMKWTRVV